MAKESPMHQAIRERIEREYSKNHEYTFTTEDFIDLAPTKRERVRISVSFYKQATPNNHRAQTLKVVGTKNIPGKSGTFNVYGVVRIPLINKAGFYKRKPKFERQFTEKDELILDREHKREAEATPATVLNLHNILFNLGGRK